MTTIDDLRAQLEASEGQDSPEMRGLRSFIKLAEQIPPGSAVMGKIQRSFVDLSARDLIQRATTFDEVVQAVGPGYSVTLEPLG
jgi:hypothetical protein